jgi:branched-chain amino acid transport system substrate-binding protein
MYLSSPDFTKFPAGYKYLRRQVPAKYGEKPIQIFHATLTTPRTSSSRHSRVSQSSRATRSTSARKALRDAIYATKDFAGITGTLTCGQYGDCGAPVIAVYQITARETVASGRRKSRSGPRPHSGMTRQASGV